MHRLIANVRRRPLLSWLGLIVLTWTAVNLASLSEYMRLWSLPSSRVHGAHAQVLVSIALPFSGLGHPRPDFFIYLIVVWPVVSMLWWKWLHEDWSFKSSVAISVVSVALPVLSGTAVTAIDLRTGALNPQLSDVLPMVIGFAAYVTLWNLATSHANSLLAQRRRPADALWSFTPLAVYVALYVGSLTATVLPGADIAAQIVMTIVTPFALVLTRDAMSPRARLIDDLGYYTLCAVAASIAQAVVAGLDGLVPATLVALGSLVIASLPLRAIRSLARGRKSAQEVVDV